MCRPQKQLTGRQTKSLSHERPGRTATEPEDVGVNLSLEQTHGPAHGRNVDKRARLRNMKVTPIHDMSEATALLVLPDGARSIVHNPNPNPNPNQVFVLDNSLRESTVGQDKGHTLADKVGVLDAVKSCGFRHIVIGVLNAKRQVDDDLVRHLKGDGGLAAWRRRSCSKEIFREDTFWRNAAWRNSVLEDSALEDSAFGASKEKFHFYAFTDAADTVKDGKFLVESEPIALRKMVEFGHISPIIEVDLDRHDLDWGGAFDVGQLVEILRKDLEFAHNANMEDGGGFINLRDFPAAMVLVPERVTALVAGLARLPRHLRPRGILVEEAMGALP